MAIDSDPELGAGIANFPSNRARLLVNGGVALAVVWLVVTLVLLPVEPQTALAVTVVIVGLATMIVGWYAAHLWNREVVLYERGFSYREGSQIAYIRYDDITSLRQRAERMSYFGGIIRRTVYHTTVKTAEDETIVLTPVYKHIDRLGVELEKLTHYILRAALEKTLANGAAVSFSDTLSVSADGLHEGGRELRWADFAGYKLQNRRLNLLAKGDDTPWLALPLADVDNIAVLLDVLRQRQGNAKSMSKSESP